MSEENHAKEIKWTIHDTNPELVEPLREALSQIVDPEIGLNIIQLGLIRDAQVIDENSLKLNMILTTPFCPYGPAMIETTRQKTQEALDKVVTIEMGTEMWDFAMMEDPTSLDWGLYA
jgi:metal-sulfur cluster biosynthetic enzyme